jgi:hypothetical protein
MGKGTKTSTSSQSGGRAVRLHGADRVACQGPDKVKCQGADKVARQVLNSILVVSIEHKREYGGMIYILRGVYHATVPVTQGNPVRVDVGLSKPNKGCPEHSIPVAYYHTHPTYSVAGMGAEYSTFSSDEDTDDIGLARSNHIDAYLGTLDGSFLKYNRKTNRILRLGRLKNTSD